MLDNVTIIDASAVIHSVIHGVFKEKSDWIINEETGKKYVPIEKFRPGLLGSFLYYKNIKHLASKCIIAMDHPPYWRKEILPFYKGTRKKGREESDVDWSKQFSIVNEIINELKEVTPWTFIDIVGLEADDVIGILSPKLASSNNVIIISADSDLVQLQKYKNIRQWSPMTKKFVIPKETPQIDLMTKVLKGDPGDGIPNIYSGIDLFRDRSDGVTTRQKPVTSKLITEAARCNWIPASFLQSDDFIANFHRNRMLVDFEFIPSDYMNECWSAYVESFNKSFDMMRFQMYLGKHRLNQMLDSIEKF